VDSCQIGINIEPWGYEDGGDWEIKEIIKDFGKTKYCISRVELDGQLWCITYTPIHPMVPQQLNVYMSDSCKACIEAVERIVKKRSNPRGNH
jgi:hypothetical protein